VDKPWFEFIGSAFVEVIFMLLQGDTPYTHTLAFWVTSLRAKSWKCPGIREGFAPVIDAPLNRTSVAANAALAKWGERTVANTLGYSVSMSMEVCRVF